MASTEAVIAGELSLAVPGVRAVLALLNEGATIPFIARYRKEASGGMDEVALRAIRDRRTYLAELDKRKQHVLQSIESQGKLDDALRRSIEQTINKTELEDLYLPFKPTRRTRASIARERGLQPLADFMWRQEGSPNKKAPAFVEQEKGVPNADAALAGARDICAERLAENPQLRKRLRETAARTLELKVSKSKDFKLKVTKFDAYAEFQQPLARLKGHQILAIERGVKEGILKAKNDWDHEREIPTALRAIKVQSHGPWHNELQEVARDALKRLMAPSVETELRSQHKERAEMEAIDIFAKNLHNLLLAAPFGEKRVLAIDPGQRTGCKAVALSETGQLLGKDVFHLVQGDAKQKQAAQALQRLVKNHRIQAVAVGNGTHGRETEAFVKSTLANNPDANPENAFTLSVSEAGASVYSASDVARQEFPDLDISFRGAISIGRRLQDPLSELVKVPPESIGVGQYQHDVSSSQLSHKLDDVVESCVNGVGVELNSASAQLLRYVAGVGPKLANNIVDFRDQAGRFNSRQELLKVKGFGPKAFQQAAGFLRISGAKNPLDESAVHPERYTLVKRIAKDLGVDLAQLVQNDASVSRINVSDYLSEEVGEMTLNDIVLELKKPGRDIRDDFDPPQFRDDVSTLDDLREGMTLQGVVTNVTAFGAFVDLGVHQDGLVHVSKLANRFVKDPSEVVSVGDRLDVTVVSVDKVRKRIGLSARTDGR